MRLSLETLPAAPAAIARPKYDSKATQIGIVHLGPGAFFRAHVASYVDTLLETDPNWAISAVALKTPGVRDALKPQDGLYTLAMLGAETRFRVIGCLRELLVASEDAEAVAARLTDPAVKLVTMTVTEKGYCLGSDGKLDLAHPDIVADLSGTPTSAIGWLVEGLARRHAAGTPPFIAMSCDNLGGNGPKLRGAVIALAEKRDPALARWIEAEVRFPSTMVDSITPATDDALRERVAAETGLEDAWPIQRETFTQWVIEEVPGLPDLAKTGATLTVDVAGFEAAKLRLLNGPHSSLAYLGLLRGHGTVAQGMTDPALAAFLGELMREDIAPTVKAPPGFDVARYIDDILERFRNPAIAHQLSQIAWDGTQKLPYRLLATIADLRAQGRPVDRPALAVSGWMRFVVRQAKAGVKIVDPLGDRLAGIGQAGDPAAFLSLPLFAAADEETRRAILAGYERLGADAATL